MKRREQVIQLFHLTAPEEDVIDAIKQEGLRPGPNSWDCWSPKTDWAAEIIGDVVWLIDDPGFLQWEGLIQPIGDADLWRVICDIPTQDPNLVHFRDCLRADVRVSDLVGHIWLYGGVVPPSRIKAIEFLGSSQSNYRECSYVVGIKWLETLQKRIVALEKGECDWSDIDELEDDLALLREVNLEADEAQAADDMQDRLNLLRQINYLEQGDEAA